MISVVLVVLIALVCTCAAVVLEDYRTGRGTFYGNEWWLWDIHQGSCGYGYLCPEEGTGWDIAALPDTHPDYSGSCGQCYEVKCNPTNFQDNYGETLWREGVCYDPEASIVVTITDTCPCTYASNFYSNMRWCCNDMEHLDLSIWAFEKLAETRWGVIGLSYRKVTCDHKPDKEAPEPDNPFGPTPVTEGTSCPKGNFPLKENWELVQMMYRKRLENAGMPSYVNAPPLSTSDYYAKLAGRDTPKQISSSVFSDYFQSGWSIYTQNADHTTNPTYGLSQSPSLCSNMYPNGNINIKGPYGSLQGKKSFSMWVRTDGGVPSLDVNVKGSNGVCSPVKLASMFYSEQQDGYSKYDVFLGVFDQTGEDVEQRTIKGMSVSHAIRISDEDHLHTHEIAEQSDDFLEPILTENHVQQKQEGNGDNSHYHVCCFTLFLIMGPILLSVGIIVLAVKGPIYLNGPKHKLRQIVEHWNMDEYSRFSSIGFEVQFFIHDYYNCPESVLQTPLPNIRYQMQGGENPLDPFPQRNSIDAYKQYKFNVQLPQIIYNLTGEMSDKCILAASVFLSGNQQNNFPVGRMSGQIFHKHHHLLSSICNYNVTNNNNNNYYYYYYNNAQNALNAHNALIDESERVNCENLCQNQYNGYVNWTQNACIQIVQLKQMCMRVREFEDEWVESNELGGEGNVGFGCFVGKNGKWMERLEYVPSNGMGDPTQNIQIDILVRSNDDPYIYFEYLTGGSLNINQNIDIDYWFGAGVVLFIVGAAVTMAWCMVCCCFCRMCCSTDKDSLMSDPIGHLYYRAAKKYHDFIIMREMKNQTFKGIPPKQEPVAYQKIVNKPNIPGQQEYLRQLLLEDQLSFGKPLNKKSRPPPNDVYISDSLPVSHPAPPPADE